MAAANRGPLTTTALQHAKQRWEYSRFISICRSFLTKRQGTDSSGFISI